jgi:hypothetical protein
MEEYTIFAFCLMEYSVMCDGWIDVCVDERREKKGREKKPGTNIGGNQAVLRVGGVSEGRAVSAREKPALAQRETPKRQNWQEPSNSLAAGRNKPIRNNYARARPKRLI